MRILSKVPLLLAALAAAVGGCDSEPTPSTEPPARVEGVTYIGMAEPAGLDRYIRWSDRVGQGAQPEGDVAFANLAALGYRTVLSVDGAIPQVELARAHGLRYVHVPIGYDGVGREDQLKILKAARESEGPIFVHCHHGTHRGPAAAMLCRMNEDGIAPEEAEAGLKVSGTSPLYRGLWEAVRTFEKPSEAELAKVAPLPSRVRPQGLRAGMVDVSERYTNLRHALDAGWIPSAQHPDIDPPHEARMLWELLREMARNETEARDRGEAFLDHLRRSEEAAIGLEDALRAGDKRKATERFRAIRGLCTDCHRDHRN